MQQLLAEMEIKYIKVILTHSDYPFTTETGYKTVFIPIFIVTLARIMKQLENIFKLFEFAPANRIMFGTDGTFIPETYWFGYTQDIKVISDALEKMIASDLIAAAEVMKFG